MNVLFSDYEERLRRLHANPETIRNLHCAVRLLDGYDPLKIEPHELEELFAGSGLAISSQHTRLGSLRAAYRYGLRRRAIDQDPTELVRLPRAPDPPVRIATNSSLRHVLANAPEHRAVLAHLLVYTGMRKAEIESLRWDSINLRRQEIDVLGKGGRRRVVPIHPALGEILAPRWRFGRRCTIAYHAAIVSLSDEGFAAHTYRRSFATSLFANGVPEAIIEKICGWAGSSIARRHYFNIADKTLHDSVLLAFADDPL